MRSNQDARERPGTLILRELSPGGREVIRAVPSAHVACAGIKLESRVLGLGHDGRVTSFPWEVCGSVPGARRGAVRSFHRGR